MKPACRNQRQRDRRHHADGERGMVEMLCGQGQELDLVFYGAETVGLVDVHGFLSWEWGRRVGDAA